MDGRELGSGGVGSGEWVVAYAHCPLPTRHSPLPTPHCPDPTPHCPLPTAHSPLPTARGPLAKKETAIVYSSPIVLNTPG